MPYRVPLAEQDLEAKLLESSIHSFHQEGEPPDSLRGLTLDWLWVPDPNDPLGRKGLHIIWRAYFDAEPNDLQREYIDSTSEFLVSDLWSRIVKLDTEFITEPFPNPISMLKAWVYQRETYQSGA